MIKRDTAAFYGAVMTFLAAFFILTSIRLGQRLEKSKDDQITGNYPIAKENAELREEREAWKDSAFRIYVRFSDHLQDDLRKSDTTTH